MFKSSAQIHRLCCNLYEVLQKTDERGSVQWGKRESNPMRGNVPELQSELHMRWLETLEAENVEAKLVDITRQIDRQKAQMAAQFKANQRVLIESVQNQNEDIAAQLQAHKQLLADRFKDLRDKGSAGTSDYE